MARVRSRSLIGDMTRKKTSPTTLVVDVAGTEDRVLGYVRVSTDDQAANGISLAEQRRRIEAYCQAHGLALVGFVEDKGESAKSLKRAGFQKALKKLKRGDAGGLVAVKLDRISRSIRDVIDLVERSKREGWYLHSLSEKLDTSTATGRFFVHMLAALAQLEREQIGERTKAAMAELKRQGKRVSGRPPFGYRFDGDRVVPVPREQRILTRIRRLAADGMGSWRIWKALNVRGGRNPRTGRPWSRGCLAAVLRTQAQSLVPRDSVF